MPAPLPVRIRVVSLALAFACLVAALSYLLIPSPLTVKPSTYQVIPLAFAVWAFLIVGAGTLAGHLCTRGWILRLAHAIGGTLYSAYGVSLIGYAIANSSAPTAGAHAVVLGVVHYAVMVAIPDRLNRLGE